MTKVGSLVILGYKNKLKKYLNQLWRTATTAITAAIPQIKPTSGRTYILTGVESSLSSAMLLVSRRAAACPCRITVILIRSIRTARERELVGARASFRDPRRRCYPL